MTPGVEINISILDSFDMFCEYLQNELFLLEEDKLKHDLYCLMFAGWSGWDGHSFTTWHNNRNERNKLIKKLERRIKIEKINKV